MNLLAGRDATIVSSSPGTTRDIAEIMLDLGGGCTILDTAGVREEEEDGVNEIEVEGMKRARVAAKEAHLIVGVVDATDYERGLEAVNELIHDDEKRATTIMYVLNKLDLLDGNDKVKCMQQINGAASFGISCTTSEGVDDFLSHLTKQALARVSGSDDDNISVEGTEGAVITRARHRRHVEASADALERFAVLSGQGYMALDLAAEELRLAASELGRITGAIDVEDVLDVLFADFCIGK